MLYPTELRAREERLPAGGGARQAPLLLLAAMAWLGGAAIAAAVEMRPPALVTLGEAEVVLAGVVVPTAVTVEAAGPLQATPSGQHDRWGRAIVVLHDAQGRLDERLVGEGRALVSPDAVAETAARLLPLEAAARDARRGFWGTGRLRVQEAGDVRGVTGDLVLVAGRVRAAAWAGDWLYLNFGADYRTDFTARLARRDARTIARGGVDPQTLPGRMVQLRGWLRYAGGPLLDIMGPAQIEMLP